MGASVKPAARRNARQFALQAIYSWQITKENIATFEEQFLSGGKYDEKRKKYRLRGRSSETAKAHRG
eukprot:TRINITY_DN3619_c0_g1_i1.p1 TRINITY_DN3619_c0_g1~~TRINITY_DN3619_c0_g1_i1.p1  ORF type:complete len:67 (+),score=32.89 TRINITY_DN3619_c0_g1_i1:52-252(+)